jgi:hypothetical protein
VQHTCATRTRVVQQYIAQQGPGLCNKLVQQHQNCSTQIVKQGTKIVQQTKTRSVQHYCATTPKLYNNIVQQGPEM